MTYPHDRLVLGVRRPPQPGDAPAVVHGARVHVYADEACTTRIVDLALTDGTPVDELVVDGIRLPYFVAAEPAPVYLRVAGGTGPGSPVWPVEPGTGGGGGTGDGITLADADLRYAPKAGTTTALALKADADDVAAALAGKASSTDPRLTDARTPTAHGHPASAITFAPTGAVGASDVQSAIAEVASEAAGLVSAEAAARTAAITAAISALVNGAPGILDTLGEIAAQLGTDEGVVSALTSTVAGKQPLDAELTALAGLVSAADRLPYFTGAGAASLATFTTYARSLLDDPDATTARATLGLGTASTLNAPAAGNAAAGEVVKGSDGRLTDARTPVAHSHPTSDVTGLDAALAGRVTTAQLTAAVLYHRPVYVLTAGQTSANLPGDFPAGGVVLRRLT